MSPKRTYYGFTTPQQRKLLFEIWQTTGSIEEACRQVRVSQRLFYYWKPRFEQHGFEGLETFGSRVAHHLNYKDAAISKRVIEMKRANPDWGKARIAQEMAKANNWVAVVCPNTVRRILETASLWPEDAGLKKNGPKRSQNG